MQSDGPHSALRWLTGCDPQDFADRFWGRELHLATSVDRERALAGDDYPADVTSVFSLAAAEELISRRGLRTPFLRMVRDGATLGNSRFTSGGGVGASINDQINDADVRDLFDAGATAVLQGLHRTWAPLTDFTHSLAGELGHPVQANCYVTPSANQGFTAHYDVHDVFVVQVYGQKQWTIHAPAYSHPLRDDLWGDRADEVQRAAAREPLLSVTLQPGDCLYLPRGFIHSARALGGTTAHLTLGVHTWTKHHLAQVLTDRALDSIAGDPTVRESLALGVTVGDTAAISADISHVREALIAAVHKVTEDQIAAVMARQARGSMRSRPVTVFGDTTSEGTQ